MKTLNLEQGSKEWLAARAKMLTASEAPAMKGASPNMSRSELVRNKHSGRSKEVSQFVQERVFDRGHEVEAKARPIAEAIVGQELYPATVCDDDERLSASLDGITMDGSVIWECKQRNADKVLDIEVGVIPECDIWQLVQQIYVTGASRLIYTITDGTEEGTDHLWVERDNLEPYFKQLLQGWEQFEADLAEHQPVELPEDATGTQLESLPYLNIQVEGRVVATNLDDFKAHALAVFDGISTDLQNDQDFADAEEAVKWCKNVEDRLKAAKDAALGQTESIDALFRAIDDISESARRKRLDLDKLVKARKEARKSEIQQQAVDALTKHYDQINAGLSGGVSINAPSGFRVEVGQAMKGKRTIQSIMDAADQALTDAKLAANAEADLIRANLAAFDELAGDHKHLFADLRNLVGKQTEDFAAAVKLRISEHVAEKARKAEAEKKLAQEEQRKEEAQLTADELQLLEKAEKPSDPKPPAPEPAQSPKKARWLCTATFLTEFNLELSGADVKIELRKAMEKAGFSALQDITVVRKGGWAMSKDMGGPDCPPDKLIAEYVERQGRKLPHTKWKSPCRLEILASSVRIRHEQGKTIIEWAES